MEKYLLLQEEVDNSYRVAQLKILYEKYIQKLIIDYPELLLENPDLKKSISEFEKSRKYKEDYVKILAAVLLQKNTFNKILTYFSTESIFLVNKLMWTDLISLKEVEQKLNIQVLEPDQKQFSGTRYTRMKSDFQILSTLDFKEYHSYNAFFYFTDKIKEIVSEYLPKPSKYYLKASKEITGEFIYENNGEILQEFPLLHSYYLNNSIKTKTNGQLTKGTTNKLRKNIALKEFYPEKETNFNSARSYLLAAFLSEIDIDTEKTNETHEIIKNTLNNNYAESYFNYLIHFLPDLKGTAYVYHNKETNSILWKVLKTLQVNEWYSFEDLIEHILIKNKDFVPINKYTAEKYLYYLKGEGNYKYRRYVNKNSYKKTIIEPIIKSTFALFAAWGLVDITYEKFSEKESLIFFSMFDKLKYVRLNSFGEYVSGQKDTFNPPKSTNEVEFYLSEKELIIEAKGNLNLAEVKLNNIAIKNNENKFTVNYDSFLKNCKNEDDIFNKIEIFSKTINAYIPANWNIFFSEIADKIEPLKEMGEAKIFNIKKDKELKKYLIEDSLLMKNVSFIDDYKIVIETKNISKIKSKLKKYGYLS